MQRIEGDPCSYNTSPYTTLYVARSWYLKLHFPGCDPASLETQPYDADVVAANFASSGPPRPKQFRHDAVGEGPGVLPGKPLPAACLEVESRAAEAETPTIETMPCEAPEAPVRVEVPRGPEAPAPLEVPGVAEAPVVLEVARVAEAPVALEVIRVAEAPVALEVPRVAEAPVALEVPSGPEALASLEVPSGATEAPIPIAGALQAAEPFKIPVVEAIEAPAPSKFSIKALQAPEPLEVESGATQKRPNTQVSEEPKKVKLDTTNNSSCADSPLQTSNPKTPKLSSTSSPNGTPAPDAQDAPAADASASKQFSVMNFQAIQLHCMGL